MARNRKSNKVKELKESVKVRLDRKTVVTLRDEEMFSFWKEKYPEATIIS
jgi:hypothetical protein